ncbi:MAG TPA: glycosyltransferase family 4 protein [Kribbellaceae bacterium]
MTVLVVTNDFPPRQGGIESFVRSLCDQLPEVVVFTASMPGASSYDEGLPFTVVRDRASMLVPTARATRRAARVLREHGCDRVLFGAAAPLGLMAPALRAAGARRVVAMTHGHETWWATVPGTRAALHRIGAGADVVTYVSRWCADRIAPAVAGAADLRPLRPGVDVGRFRPGCGGAELRGELGLTGVPVVTCVSRLVPRKGQDTLIRAWPRVLARVPDAVLVLVGGGPARGRLEELARSLGVAGAVRFTGSVPWAGVPPYAELGDVFAMPCRTRRFGLEPEALGIALLEAAACGLPVVAGDSGGVADAVRHGETGYLVDPYNPVAVAVRLVDLLLDPDRARRMGECGREWVAAEWTWDRAGAELRSALDLG